ncbi:hypothetical protein POV27_08850 [Aureisphaera galaxeae]|uniref:hypothetical protein n=1 Tax=Aureisphaera galaxeae TaxID=1538023 RepID=UPI0023507886|nr:hypothetical protein [Aureisphaera galaxeae]MDC8004157.1 hypothetical protein [Aureisphaera galaxeae]
MENTSLLRKALKANGFFSLLMGIITMTLGNTVTAVYEMANGQPLFFGMQLCIFSLFVLFNAFYKRVFMGLVWFIIVLDILYVLLGFYSLSLVETISQGGLFLIIITNLIVLMFAFFQTKGVLTYKKSKRQVL